MRNGKISTLTKLLFKAFFICVLFVLPETVSAQYDYEHYVPPFYNGSSNNGDIGYHKAVLSTNSVKEVKVSIYKGYSTLIDEVTVKLGSPVQYSFKTVGEANGNKGRISEYPNNYNFPWNVVGAKELNVVLPDEGLRFFSSDAPFFVNMRHSTDVQGGSLTTKGTYAYGTEFLSGHVYTDTNHSTSRRSHFISVMATEDNTTVNFTDIKCSMLTEYDDKGDGIGSNDDLKVKWVNPTDVITPSRTLNKGESYIIAVDHNLPGFTNAMNDGMNGTSITSDKPIAVNSGSWTSGPSDGQDIGVDQIVPIDQLRDEYIVMRGEGAVRTEQPIVVATEDDTEVFVNGISKGTIASKGGFLALPDPYDSNGNAFISTGGKSVYVYQTLSGDSKTIGPTVGMNFIPPVSTSGIREVTVPFADELAERGVSGVITILAQTNADVYYAKNGDPNLHPISEITTAPITISGHPQWEIYKLTEMSGNYRFYANKAINVAWLVKSGYVGAAGYYSGFTKEISKIVPDLDVDAGGELDLICESYDDDISVAIKEPLPDFYEWYVNDFTQDPIIENGPLVVPAPDEETSYYVVGSYRDPIMDQLYNGTFFDQAADSDYTEVFGNLQLPGEYCVVIQTTDANPSFKNPTFTDMDNGRMFMAISDQKGDTIYRGTSVDVVEGFNYIVKLHGRSVVDATYTQAQNLKVLVNGDTIIDNFRIDDTENWQSVSALWKPGTASDGIVKILNNNPSGVNSAFALDSITFVQAVQDTAVFVARVIPNYSYGNNGATEHFCKGVTNSLDVSNGDTSWYTYSWSKDGVDLEDGAIYSGVKSHELVFIDPQDSQEGEYVCEIGFKEEYQDCGTSDATVNVTLTVLVDEVATVTIDADQTSFCAGASATLSALVVGDAGDVKWFVDGDTSPVSLENPYTFNYPTGTYTVRCEVENGCGVAFDEVTINVLSAPVLNSLTTNDDLCEGQPIILTADAVGDGVLTYTWRRDALVLSETGSVLNYPADISDREATFKVKVTSVYTFGDETVECPNSTGLAVYDLDIFPLVAFDKALEDATVCEGSNHSFNVTMDYPGSFYTYQWDKDGVDLLNNLSSQNLSSVKPITDEGKYRVVVTNRCNSEFSEADLIVTPEIKVNGFDLDLTGPFCIATDVTATFDVDINGAAYIYQAKDPNGVITTITNPYTFTLDASNEGLWEFYVSSTCDAPVSFTSSLNMHEDFGALSVADVGTCIGETVTFEASVSDIPAASTLTYAWTDNLGNPIGTNSDQLEIVNVQDANLGTYTVVVSDQCGNNKTESGELTKEAVTSPATAPATTVCEGDSFTSTIAYLGTPSFEWRFNDPVTGPVVSTTETLNIAATTLADAGVYYCNVELICGTNVVIQRELIVNAHISVVGPLLETLNVCDSEKPLLEIDVNGDLSDYTIEWRNGGGALLRTGPFIQLDKHIAIPFPYTYTANVIGLCETIVKTYKINVHENPAISAVDNSVTACSGLVSLDVTVTGEHNGIVWWKDGVIITDGNADQTNYVIDPATSPADDGEYIAKIESDYCSDDQASIFLDVINTIVVTNQSPATTTVCENVATSLSVTATGDDIEYKWYKTADPATTLSDQATYDLGNILFAQAGEYKCDLFNDANCGNQTLTFNVVVEKHATVTNPLSVTMCETDADPVFTVTGTGEPLVTYQWFDKDDIAVAGATTNTLTVTSPVDGQSYYCVVSGSSCDAATSNKASLTIIKNVSVTDPLDLTISDGANASFTVVASGEPAYSYQWQENTGSGWNNISDGGKYSGANLAKLQITNADKATFDTNQYRCVVGSSGAICASSATSNAATLTIAEVTKIAVQPNGTTVCFNDNATLSVEGTKAGLTYTWNYKKGAGVYGAADSNDGMTVSLVGNVSTLTIPATDLDINNWTFQCVVSDGVSTDQISNEVVVTVLEDIAVATADASFTPCINENFSLSVVATGDEIKYKWYKVGAEATILSTNATYNFGNIELADEGDYKCEIYNDLHCNDIIRTFNVDVLELSTVTDPSDQIMCSTDANPTFTVTTGGDGPFTYKWYNSTGVIAGAITNSYTETSPVDGETYYCEVITSCNTIQSKSALLTVVQPLSVTNPLDVTIADGANATFSVVASGEPNYSYQWQENDGSGWSDISDAGKYSGSNTSSLVINNALKADFDGNQYRCILNTDGLVCIPTVTSGIANLTINNVVKIAVQAIDAEICFGDNATISVEGTSDALTYTWEYNDGSGTFVNADGVASMSAAVAGKVSTLTIPGNDLDINNWTFRCLVSDGVSTQEYSQIVEVTVLEDIAVTPGLLAHVLCENEALSMSVVATAGDNILYKWYKDTAPGTIVSTNSTFNIGNVVLADEGNYTCEVYNLKGCNDQTINFTLDVQEHVSTSDPVDVTMCSTDPNPVFAVVASGDGPFTYKWFNSAGEIAGATLASYTETAPVDGESYYCEVSNACNTVVSKSADLVVVQPLAVSNPSNLTIADGGDAEFTVVASGEPNYTYQWQEDSGSGFADITDDATYLGATTAILTIRGADKATFNTNRYQCVVNTDGLVCIPTVTSGIATLTVNDVDKILNQPNNAEVCFNTNAVLTIEGTTTTLNYLWQFDDGVSGFVDIIAQPGMTVNSVDEISTLTVVADDLDISTWKFKCIVSDGVSTDEESSEVTITVLEDIAVSTVDASFTPCADTPFSITVTATAGDNIKYKWYKVGDETNILSTSATYNFGNIVVADEGDYKCEIYNDLHCNDVIRTFDIDVLELATVTDPSDHIMCSTDANPSFSVTAGGDGPFTYKWYNKAGVIAGAITDSYTETSPVDGETYYCEVITACNTIKSKSALLTVVQPLSVTNPIDVTIADGANATFSVVASGEPNYSYQWQENDGSGWSDVSDAGKYSGATTSSLLITNALEADFNGNQYRCIVDTDGVVCIPSVTSGIATLTINTIVKIAVQADDAEICFGDNATISVEGTRDALIYTWEYNDGSGTFVNADGVASMSAALVGKVSTLTIPGNDLDINNWTFRCLVSDAVSTDEYSQIVKVRVLEDIAVTPGLLAHVLCENEALSMSVVATAGDDILYKWYKDTAPGTILSTNSTFNIGNVVLADEGNYTCEVYNLKACNDQTINFTLDVKEHVSVSTLLDEEMCTSDTPPTFTVVASGDAPFSYKWFNSTGEIIGATLASYTVVAPVDGESYYCEVSNSCNTVASNAAIITVNEEVTITTQPIALNIVDGADASFTVAATGEPVLIYQWQEDSGSGFNDITDNAVYSGANSPTLSITDADRVTFNGNQYRCKVDNGCSVEQISDEVGLTVNALIKIFTQPDNLEVCLPSTAVFEIIGTSNGLTYDWEYSTDGVTYNTVTTVPEIVVTTDATGSKLTIATTTLTMNTWTFHCIVKDGSSADETSSVVFLTVVEPVNFDPLIDENLCFGIEKQISLANVSGTGPITYSWSDGVSEVSTTTDLSIGASDNGNYVVTAGNGSVCPDKTDDLDVLHYSALSLSAWSNTDQVCVGATEVLTVGVANKDALLPTETYQWYKDGAPISTDPTYSVVAADKTHSGQYKVEVYDGCSTESVSGYVTAYETIVATNTWGAATTICLGTELKLETLVTGDVTSYTWTKDGIAIAGVTSSTYLKAVTDASDAGTYVCTIVGNCGTDITYTINVSILAAPEITTGIDAIPAVCEGDALVIGDIALAGPIHDDPIWTLNDGSTNVVTTDPRLDLGTAELTMAGNYKVSVSNICGTDVSYGNQVVNPILSLEPIADQTVCEGDDVVFRADATGTDLTYQWTVDGVVTGGNSPELVLDGGSVLPDGLNTSKVYNVVCNISSTTGCGTDTETANLTVKPRTVLHATLKNVVKYIGEDYTMTVDVSGVDLVFEWTHEALDGTKTPLAITGNEVVLTDISMTDAGYYTCKITGPCGQRLASGKLTVKEPVTIGTELNAFEEKCVGDPLNLAISATGQITSIKWYKDGVLMPAETSLNLFIPALTLTDAGEYKCEIVGEGTSGITQISTVRVYSQTVLNTSLSDMTLCENAILDWIPDVGGTSAQTYKWYLDGTEVFTGKILHYDALALSHEGDYEVQVTSLCGDVNSSANLAVIELPVYVSSSTDQEVCENYELVEFSVEYTGENLRYQWRKDGVDLADETTSTLSLTFIQLDDAGAYTCRVYSTCGEEISPAANLSVTPQLKILSDQVDIAVCNGEDVVLIADVEGINVTYQWKLDGIDLDIATHPEANSPTLNLSAVTSVDDGYYTCIVSDDCTASRSTKPTKVTVNELPNTSIYGRMVLCAKEDRVTYVLNQEDDDMYNWGVDGGILAGPEDGARTRITWEEVANGNISVIISDLVTGCESRVDSAVVLNALPVVNLEALESKGVCEGEFELTGGFPEGGIYWVNGISQTVFNPSDRGAGIYNVHYSYTDEHGCSNVTEINDLQVDVLPVVDITDDITVGSCTPTQLTASTDEDNIQWFKIQDNNRVLPVDLDDANSLTPIFTPGESQVLLASVQDEHACEGIDIINLDVAPLPVVTTINDTTVGACNQLVLLTDIVGDQDVISWTNADHLDDANARSPKIINAPEGTHTYTINVTDLYGCDATGEVTVTMVDNPTLGEDIFGCEGDSFEVNLASLDNPFWSNSDWDNAERERINALDAYTVETPGQYLLEVSNEYDCGDEQLFVINPTPDLGLKDTLLFEGQTVTLGPNLPSEFGPYFFEWQDGSILQRLDVSEEGEYILKVEDNIGCVAIDTSFVTVKPVGIEAPNAFIPLGDDDNNRFYLKEINVIEEFEMYVYDRWGELLFKTDEAGRNGGWDGKYKGKLCPAGAYVWVAFINGELTNKGTFVLVR